MRRLNLIKVKKNKNLVEFQYNIIQKKIKIIEAATTMIGYRSATRVKTIRSSPEMSDVVHIG